MFCNARKGSVSPPPSLALPSPALKAELSTLRRSGTFYFALTRTLRATLRGRPLMRVAAKAPSDTASRVRFALTQAALGVE